jgi:hypothetical protein
MAIATAKWQKRCARRATEQRVQSKARLRGKPEAPTLKTPRLPEPAETKVLIGIDPAYGGTGLMTFSSTGPWYITEVNTDFGYRNFGQMQTELTLVNPWFNYQPTYQPMVMGTNGGIDYFANTITITMTLNDWYGTTGATTEQFNQLTNVMNNQTPYQYQGGKFVAIGQHTEDAWAGWNGNVLTVADNNAVWRTWNDQLTFVLQMPGAQFEETEEQREAREARAAEHRRTIEEREERTRAANARALELFLHVLKPAERETFEKEKCLYVKGSRGRRYRIRCEHTKSHNVEWLDDAGQKRASLCAYPGGNVPNPDAWMVQKLMLELDEDEFCRIANYSGAGRPADLIAA